MSKIHIEFDLSLTDEGASDLLNRPEGRLMDCIINALVDPRECFYMDNFFMDEI